MMELERGKMYSGTHIVLRAMCHQTPSMFVDRIGKGRWDITMPRRDKGIVNPFDGFRHNIESPLLSAEAKDGQTVWIPLAWQWGWGIYIGDAIKYEGTIIDGGEYGAFDFGAKKRRFATIALKGTNNSFVLAYSMPEYMKEQDGSS